MGYRLIFNPTGKPMRIAGFGSGSGTNLRALIEEERRLKDKGGYSPFETVVLLMDRNAAGVRDLSGQYEIPLVYDSFVGFCREQGFDIATDEAKEAWYPGIVDALKPYNVDLIALGGYMLWVKEPLLSAYRDRIINVHPADLSILDENGERIYTGDNAVFDALRDGYRYTKSSIHIVNEGNDAGEILVQSKPLEATGLEDAIHNGKKLKELAKQHQQKQKEKCDWPAYIAAVKLISTFNIIISDKRHQHQKCRIIYVDGTPMPYGGYQLK